MNTSHQPLSAAQLDRAHRYAAEMLGGVQLRKWAVETALAHNGDMQVAADIYAFVTAGLDAEVKEAAAPVRPIGTA